MQIPSFRAFASSFLALGLTGAIAFAGSLPPVVRDIKGGAGSLTLSSQITAVLALAQVKLIKVAPGTVSVAKGKITIPVLGGALDTITGNGEIASGGGFKFVKDTSEVSAIDYVITITNGQGTISALITINGSLIGRTSLATFPVTLPTPVVVPKNNKIKLENLALTLSADSATALNQAFSTTFFAAGQDLGAYNVTLILAPKFL